MDSFISWVGGKKALREEIVSKFPEKIDKYVEVFGGAAWVLFYKDKHAQKEVYNDINSELVNLFRCIKYHPEAVEKELQYALTSREMFERCRRTNIDNLTDIQRAARYLFMIRVSFGSSVRSFGCEARPNININNIDKIKKRLSRVLIENKSFTELIKAQDRDGTLFYCDPPYHKTEKHYDTGEFVFDETQHILLRDILQNIKGKFILSYNDDDFVRDLYKNFKIESIDRTNNLSQANGNKNKRFKELIIKNY